jgi:oligopeptide transport system permease protein
MQRYLIGRLLWMVPVLFFVALMTFSLMHAVPGGPFERENRSLPPATIENLRRRYGLDRPLPEQFLRLLGNALRGDLGVSYQYQDRPVTQVLLQGLPRTATLGLIALAIALGVGIPLGTLAALRQNSWVDYLSLFLATLGASVPNFVVAIVLVIIFSVWLHQLPTGGWGTPKHLIMPALALAFGPTAYIARMTRASMLDAIRQDYVRTARAKGLHERTVISRHTLPNALIPVLTVVGPITANLLLGSFIIESIFSIPGIGREYVQSIGARDYGMIMGTTLFYAVVIAVANLIVDLLYGVVDPRIRYG